MDAQIVVRLPIALKEQCEEIANREMMSVSDVARQALKARVEQDKARTAAQQQLSTAEAGS